MQLAEQQMEWVGQSVSEVLRGVEALYELRRNAVRAARVQHEASVAGLRDAQDLSQVLAVQMQTVNYVANSMLAYWQQWAGIAVRTEAAVVQDAASTTAVPATLASDKTEPGLVMPGLLAAPVPTGLGPFDLFSAPMNMALKALGEMRQH